MTRDPTAYLDKSMCDYCETEHLEDDLVEYERDQCARANDEEAAALAEMAADDKAHAAMERMWEDG